MHAKSIFQGSTTDLNAVLFFELRLSIEVKWTSLSSYLALRGGGEKILNFTLKHNTNKWNTIQTALSRVWICAAESISYVGNRYTARVVYKKVPYVLNKSTHKLYSFKTFLSEAACTIIKPLLN